MILSNNGTQMVGAANELKEMVKNLDGNQLREFCGEKGIKWIFTTPAAPHQNGCAEALVKTCKRSLKIAIGEQLLDAFRVVHLPPRDRKPVKSTSHWAHP